MRASTRQHNTPRDVIRGDSKHYSSYIARYKVEIKLCKRALSTLQTGGQSDNKFAAHKGNLRLKCCPGEITKDK